LSNSPAPNDDLEDDLAEGSIGIPFDLLRMPVIGPLLKWRHSRTVLAIPLLIVSLAMILHGLLGPTISPKNLATVLTWVHFRGALVLLILVAGNFFCMACPFMLARNAMRRLIRPRFNWPRRLRNKWVAVTLFALILFVYELFGLWSSPWLTAWIIAGYFLTAVAVDGFFKHATFCKFLCPLGQFNFIASTVAPLEVAVRDQEVCSGCRTKDCIRGKRAPGAELVVMQRGCELALFLPGKAGNMDCTFCLDCVHACPEDNIGILSRLPASDLMADPSRSGIGYFSRRKDIAALVLVFCFGALTNAFTMVSPAYTVETWLGRVLHIQSQPTILGLLFTAFLVVEPAILLGGAAWMTRATAGVKRAWLPMVLRYTYALVPLGFGMWLAHYGFHFFTGLYTIVPVTQNAVASLGLSILGEPRWMLVGLPKYVVEPIEFGFLLLGLAGSLLIAWRLADEDAGERRVWAFSPWAAVCVLLFLASVWLMTQPMDMRATMMAG
jgi:hypothetical protein